MYKKTGEYNEDVFKLKLDFNEDLDFNLEKFFKQTSEDLYFCPECK